jgi:chromosome segregation ATPase
MGFNTFGGKEAPQVIITKEAVEAQSAQSLAQMAKKAEKIQKEIDAGAEILKGIKTDILQAKKDLKAEENAFSEALFEREQNVAQREATVKSREMVLEGRQAEFQNEKNTVLQDLAAKQDRLLLIDHDLEQLKARLASRETLLKSREKEIIALDSKVISRNQELDKREKMFKSVEIQLNETRRAVEAEQFRVSKAQEALVLREQAVSQRENQVRADAHAVDLKLSELKVGKELLAQKTETAEKLARDAAEAGKSADFLKKQAEGQALENEKRTETLDALEEKLNTLKQQLMGDK